VFVSIGAVFSAACATVPLKKGTSTSSERAIGWSHCCTAWGGVRDRRRAVAVGLRPGCPESTYIEGGNKG